METETVVDPTMTYLQHLEQMFSHNVSSLNKTGCELLMIELTKFKSMYDSYVTTTYANIRLVLLAEVKKLGDANKGIREEFLDMANKIQVYLMKHYTEEYERLKDKMVKSRIFPAEAKKEDMSPYISVPKLTKSCDFGESVNVRIGRECY
jgi:hypothetical protein